MANENIRNANTSFVEQETQEVVLQIKRVSKKAQGGNKIGFTALVIVGDRKGSVGVALGKAKDVASAVKKGIRLAKKKMVKVSVVDGTIPYEIRYKKKASEIILKPGRKGTGLIAGGAVREIASLAGIENMVAKIIGSRNKNIIVWATWEALRSFNK